MIRNEGFYVKYLDKFQALIQLKDANAAAQTKLVCLFDDL